MYGDQQSACYSEPDPETCFADYWEVVGYPGKSKWSDEGILVEGWLVVRDCVVYVVWLSGALIMRFVGE